MEAPTATELALPGLEGSVVTSEPSPEHFIVRGPQKRLMVFAGRSHPQLATSIAEKLGVELGDVELETFANGETYCRYLESIRGADVFIVQTGVGNVDRNLMELVFMIQAATLASAKRITAVVPLFPYARQDRKARDKIAIVGDDVIMTGGTWIANVHALLEQGAREVYVYATHGVFCGGALAKFQDAPIEGMVITDTVPVNRLEAPPNLTVLPV